MNEDRVCHEYNKKGFVAEDKNLVRFYVQGD